MSKSQNGSTNDLSTKAETENKVGDDDFIQVKKKSDKSDLSKAANDKKNGEEYVKKKSKSRSRNNSIGEGKPSKPRLVRQYRTDPRDRNFQVKS